MRPGSEAPTSLDEPAEAPAIEVDHLSLVYHVRPSHPSLGAALKSVLSRRGPQEIEALRDVSLAVPRGDIFGVIGKNGAGKSTLLRAIAGIIPPTQGRITVRGRVTPLLSLGVGFNKQLTGRENIVIGTLTAGFEGAEGLELMDEIIEFTELGSFIDYPVRSYSSGMRARLGFAVAAHLDPEILLIDEALGVGDAAFKEKCSARMQQMCGEGRTVVIVTHGVGTVLTMASACLWLHQGRVAEMGSPHDVVDAYMRFSRLKRTTDDDDLEAGESWSDAGDDSWGDDSF